MPVGVCYADFNWADADLRRFKKVLLLRDTVSKCVAMGQMAASTLNLGKINRIILPGG